jgi:probable phosphoglycerate mutase
MREKEPSTRLILMRHGKTDFPLDRIYCDDREDPPLNAEGRAQAELAGRLLRELGVDCIYASPIGRTHLTSQIVNENLKLRVATDPRLKERYFGAWEGLYFHEIQASYPDLYEAWKMTPAAFQPPSGESMAHSARPAAT